MSAGTGFFGFSGASTAAIQDQARAASYTVQNDPRANALYDFLGMPNRAIPAEIASHRPRTNETLLDAYKGRNALLSDTIDGLVLSDNEPETLIIFPWMQTDEKNFKYNTIEFNRALPGPTPHEGTSRLLTSSHSSKSFTTQRRGIKFRLEGDFAATAQGQAAYYRNIIGMSQAVQEMATYECDAELLNCKEYNKEYAAQRKERGLEWRRVLINECDDFAAACIDPNRLERIIERNKEIFSKRRIVPDALLTPPGTKLFLSTMSHGSRTMFQTFGPDGTAMFEEGPRAAGLLRDLVVFEAREFDVNIDGPAIMPLERPTTVGECYPMSFGYRRGMPLSGQNKYITGQRDKYIYDFGADEYKKVSFAKAFLYSHIFMNRDHGYAPDVHFGRMADELSAAVASNQDLQDELKTYEDCANLHDTIMGDEESRRSFPMMIAHDPANNCFFVPRVLGQFDLDVINTADFVQMAQSVLENMKNPQTGAVEAARQTIYLNLLRNCGRTAMAAADNEALAAFNTAFPSGPKRDARFKALGRKDANGKIIEQYVPYSLNSPATVLNLNSPAALLFGALPLATQTETLLYSPIDSTTKKLSVAPANNKLAAWLANVHKTASASGKEDAPHKNALQERMKLISKCASAFGKMTASNALSIRENLVKVLDDNISSSGAYKDGKSFVTLEKDLGDAVVAASGAAAHPNQAASAVLYAQKSETSVNPFGENIPVVELSDAHIEAVQPAFDKYLEVAGPMEDRLLLHGNAEFFNANAPLEWVKGIEAGNKATAAQLKHTKAVAESFDAAHKNLVKAVSENILDAGAAVDEEDDQFVERGASQIMADSRNYMTSLTAAETDHIQSSQGDFIGAADFYHPDGEQNLYAGARPVRVPSSALILERGAYAYRQTKSAVGSAAVPSELRDIYNLLLNIKNTRECWMMLIDANIHVPINLILWRLWIRIRMYTVIMLRTGVETGVSAYGHSNFVVCGEGGTKTIEAHLTFSFGSICWNEKGVIHLPNVIPRGYMGGWNNQFIESRREIHSIAEEDRGSIIVTAIPITENTHRYPLNFVPKQRTINTVNATSSEYKDKVALYGTYSSAAFYEALWDLKDSVAFSEAYDQFATQYRIPNTIAYQGKSFDYSPATGGFSVKRSGNGHLSGNRTGRGCTSTWEGNSTMFPDQTVFEQNLNLP